MHSLRALLVIASLAACHHRAGDHVTGGVLGRVVIYRNGVAFYERTARVVGGSVTVQVPRDRVDDFLKSLTVVDRVTRKPLAVTIPRRQAGDGGFLTMSLETPDAKDADVLLTYVTEAPAWKPSYRVVVGRDGKVMLEGWAVVDNTTSEDWKGVLVGVGASSALAFRYDLWSVRQIDRDLLQGEERFAIAPPTGVSPYANDTGATEIASLDAGEVHTQPGAAYGTSFSGASSADNQYVVDGLNTTGIDFAGKGSQIRGVVTDGKSGEKLAGVTVVAVNGSATQTAITDENGFYQLEVPPGTYTTSFYYGDAVVQRDNVQVAANKVTPVHQKLAQKTGGGEVIQISAAAPTIEATSTTQGITIDKNYTKNVPVGRTFGGVLGAAAGSQVDGLGTPIKSATKSAAPPAPPQPNPADEKYKAIVAAVQKDHRDVVIEVHGAAGTEQAALARGNDVKSQLVDRGIGATKIHVVPKLGPSEGTGVRVLAVAPHVAKEPTAPPAATSHGAATDTPVGESHFMADRPMTVKAGTSAMVAMVHGETTGGVVYLYDPISDRGDARFAFKAVRLDNPTSDTLEPGPVTVYGDGRFIGEGITEPVPPHASVVVPFALDRQIVVEREGSEQDKIARLVTVQRGMITAELQHRRATKLSVTSRLAAPTTVYLRHRLESGWTLVDAPSRFTKVGDSQLFQIDLQPGETKAVTIAEATPVQRTFDLGNEQALGMMKVFVAEPDASPQLRAQIESLLGTHRSAMDLVDKIETLREQLAEYRARSGELNAQLVSLKAVRTGGDLMTALRAKLAEMSERVQKTTIALVDTQEKLMLARVKFQNQLADLRLTDATAPAIGTR